MLKGRWANCTSDSFVARLPSCAEGLYFMAEFAVVWRRTWRRRRGINLSAAVNAAILGSARNVVKRFDLALSEPELAEFRINEELGAKEVICNGAVRLLDVKARLRVDQQIALIAHEYERRRREAHISDLNQRAELARLTHFKATTLSDPASLLAYRLMNSPDIKLTDLDVTAAERIVLAVNDYDPSGPWIAVSKALSSIASNLTGDQCVDLVGELGKLASRYGLSNEAETLSTVRNDLRKKGETQVNGRQYGTEQWGSVGPTD